MDKKDEAPKTLEPTDIDDVERPSRRSAISLLGALLSSAIVGAVITDPSEAEACRRRTGRTDSDPQDGAGRGRTGLSDSDRGDEGGCGRGRRQVFVRPRGCTDSDTGRYADRPGRGRHCR